MKNFFTMGKTLRTAFFKLRNRRLSKKREKRPLFLKFKNVVCILSLLCDSSFLSPSPLQIGALHTPSPHRERERHNARGGAHTRGTKYARVPVQHVRCTNQTAPHQQSTLESANGAWHTNARACHAINVQSAAVCVGDQLA